MPPKLRPVAAGETAPKAPPKSVSDAAANGDTRDLLVSLRTRIAKSVDDPNASQRDLASLSRRLLEIAREIEAIDTRAEQEANASADVSDGAFDASAI
jgi:hypothetical protein